MQGCQEKMFTKKKMNDFEILVYEIILMKSIKIQNDQMDPGSNLKSQFELISSLNLTKKFRSVETAKQLILHTFIKLMYNFVYISDSVDQILQMFSCPLPLN